ncbi:MAG: Type 1 glutamine amidotransferase-like domain-containing protein [bacterium]
MTNKTIILLSYYGPAMSWLLGYLSKRNVKKIAYILNAKKPVLKKDYDEILKEIKIFEKHGLNVDVIDLEKTDDLEDRLMLSGAIYVKGGNTFKLLKAMKETGFDKVITNIIAKDVIYIGESAGSYVACPTIEMAHWKHQDANKIGLEDLTALSLVPYLLTVHYKDEFKTIINNEISKSKYEVRILRDNQLILIENDKQSIIEV